MDYGRFDDERREYVITRPDTPLPWLNYLGQENFFGLCTNTGGGYSFWKDARLRRLTRYRYNNLPYDTGGRYLYVNDGGSVWNPGWKPVKAGLDHYECRMGLGYTRIRGERDGLELELTFFVPVGEDLELWKVVARNKSGARKRPRLFSYQEFCFYEALNDMTNYQRTLSIGEVEVEGGRAGEPGPCAIYHRTEYRERRSHYALFACLGPATGFDTSREAFVGVHEGLHEARVPFAGAATCSRAYSWNPIGSHQVDLDLGPGEEAELAFMLAYVEQGDAPKFASPDVMDKSRGRALMERYAKQGAVDAAFEGLGRHWDGLLGSLGGELPDPRASRMLNVWNQYQCMATFNLSRSASLYETGIGRGMGFRDSAQDLLGFVHMVPDRARERLLDLAATQLSDGTCFHQYQPLTKKGNAEVGGGFNDDPLWLVLAACAYVRETGDASVLDAPCGFADAPAPATGPGGPTLLDHLEASMAYTMARRGPNGLPLIGHADWNDCLNLNCFSTEPNESFQTAGDVEGSVAESVMIAGLFLQAAREMAALYDFIGLPARAARALADRAAILGAVEEAGWDGEWYRRAYDAAGRPIGSASCDEGRIFIESQAWCVLGGAGADGGPGGTAGRARTAMRSLHERLYTPKGVVLQQPAYTAYRVELGEISSYPPGVKENAGIFCHNNAWIHLAWCLLGEGDRAFEYYLSICPAAKEAEIETYRSEPYAYAQMIAGRDAPNFGEAKNSWLTGTAAWTLVALSQGILGLRPDYAGLVLDPCVPAAWKGFTATRRFRGATYRIEVANPRGAQAGVSSLRIDGRDSPVIRDSSARGALLPLFEPGTEHRIEAALG